MGKGGRMRFTSETVADLFVGQEIIDRKKKELRQFEPKRRGLCRSSPLVFSQENVVIERFDVWQLEWRRSLSGLPLFTVSGVPAWTSSFSFGNKPHWHYVKNLLDGGDLSIVLKEWPIVEIETCQHQFGLAEILAIHTALPAALNALLELSAARDVLERKLEVFLRQAKEI